MWMYSVLDGYWSIKWVYWMKLRPEEYIKWLPVDLPEMEDEVKMTYSEAVIVQEDFIKCRKSYLTRGCAPEDCSLWKYKDQSVDCCTRVSKRAELILGLSAEYVDCGAEEEDGDFV